MLDTAYKTGHQFFPPPNLKLLIKPDHLLLQTGSKVSWKYSAQIKGQHSG